MNDFDAPGDSPGAFFGNKADREIAGHIFDLILTSGFRLPKFYSKFAVNFK